MAGLKTDGTTGPSAFHINGWQDRLWRRLSLRINLMEIVTGILRSLAAFAGRVNIVCRE